MTLKLMPLGGVGETGALNCMLYETDTTAILVDCGVGFANDRFPGVDVMIPNFDVLERVRNKLQAVVLTHGHEDHVGALPYFLQRFPVPVYATEFTRGVVWNKLEEFKLTKIDVRELVYDQTVQIGDVTIEPVYVNHSIMDVAALHIHANGRTAFHCTDFKIDHTAPDSRVTDLERMKEMGKEGLDLLLLDSTSVLNSGWTISESKVQTHLLELFKGIKGRIIACLFSSNSYRMQSLIDCAQATGRKVALTGFSTKEYTRIATSIGRLDLCEAELYDAEDIKKFDDDEILVIVTGSQAEPRSVLSRLSTGSFGPFKIKEGDTVVMTSRMIPGNEGRILEMLNRIALLGAEVISEGDEPHIHASGHAREDELREIMKALKPKYFIPIHGEYRYLRRHAQIAVEEGVAADHSMVITNGQCAELTKDSLRVVDEFEVGVVFMSENSQYTITLDAVNRRKKLALNGLVVVSVLYDAKTHNVATPASLFSEGIFGGVLEADIAREFSKFLDNVLDGINPTPQGEVVNAIKAAARKFYKSRYEIKPEVIVMVHEV